MERADNTNSKVETKTRSSKDYTLTILVDKTPKEAFDAINNVRGWWSGDIEGRTD